MIALGAVILRPIVEGFTDRRLASESNPPTAFAGLGCVLPVVVLAHNDCALTNQTMRLPCTVAKPGAWGVRLGDGLGDYALRLRGRYFSAHTITSRLVANSRQLRASASVTATRFSRIGGFTPSSGVATPDALGLSYGAGL